MVELRVGRALVSTMLPPIVLPLRADNHNDSLTPMQIKISTKHGDISDATKEKITQKVEKLRRFFDRLTSLDVVVNLEKADEPIVDVTISSEKRNDFVASYQSNDLFGSVDQIVAKLEQQIKKHKEKLQDRGKNVPSDVPLEN